MTLSHSSAIMVEWWRTLLVTSFLGKCPDLSTFLVPRLLKLYFVSIPWRKHCSCSLFFYDSVPSAGTSARCCFKCAIITILNGVIWFLPEVFIASLPHRGTAKGACGEGGTMEWGIGQMCVIYLPQLQICVHGKSVLMEHDPFSDKAFLNGFWGVNKLKLENKCISVSL